MAEKRPWIWPYDVLHFVFFGGQLVLLALVASNMPDWGWWLLFDLLAIGSLLAIIRFSPQWSLRRAALVRLLHGCTVVPLVFTQVGLTIKALGLHDQAPLLEAIDRWLFLGHNPLEALEAVSFPFLTELMQWAYTAYILLPPATIILLAVKGDPAMIARSLFSLLGIMYLSYVGYYLVPAMGPNIHNNIGPLTSIDEPIFPLYHFETDLPGVWLTEWLRWGMFAAEVTKKDCFPSGHTAIAVASAVYAFRIGRTFGWIFLPVCTGVVLSTVYLRYHYVVDVLAGLLLAVFCLTIFERIHRRFEPVLFSSSLPEES